MIYKLPSERPRYYSSSFRPAVLSSSKDEDRKLCLHERAEHSRYLEVCIRSRIHSSTDGLWCSASEYKNLITPTIKKMVLAHVEKTLAVSNQRPAKEITTALLSWKRAREHLRELEKITGNVNGKRLLEVGSGYGLFLTLSLLKGARSVGVEPATNRPYSLTWDISRRILQKAGYSKNLVKNSVGEKLPFRDNFFDLVISFYSLEHVQNVAKVIREAARVTKPGGHIFFMVPNYGSFWEGHYGILWIPYIPKTLAKYYVRVWGKDEKLLSELQLVNSFMLKSIIKKLPLEVVDMGKISFREKVLKLNSHSEGTLGSAYKVAKFFKKIKVLNLLIFLANLIEAQTPIIFVARKV